MQTLLLFGVGYLLLSSKNPGSSTPPPPPQGGGYNNPSSDGAAKLAADFGAFVGGLISKYGSSTSSNASSGTYYDPQTGQKL